MPRRGKDKPYRAVVIALVLAAIILHGAIAALLWLGTAGLSLGGPLAHGAIALLVLAVIAKASYVVARHFRKRGDSGAACRS